MKHRVSWDPLTHSPTNATKITPLCLLSSSTPLTPPNILKSQICHLVYTIKTGIRRKTSNDRVAQEDSRSNTHHIMPREATEEVKEQYVITPCPTSILSISLRILNRPLFCSEYWIFLTTHPTDSSPVPKRQSQRATSTASEELRKPIATRFIFPALLLQVIVTLMLEERKVE